MHVRNLPICHLLPFSQFKLPKSQIFACMLEKIRTFETLYRPKDMRMRWRKSFLQSPALAKTKEDQKATETAFKH
jgi:hypothetical protein